MIWRLGVGIRVDGLRFRVGISGFRVQGHERGSLQGGRGKDGAARVRFGFSGYRGTSLMRNTHPPRITIGP